MDAEIIAVGSELLTPARLDTNSLYLTEKLNGLGVEVVRKTVIGDDRIRLAEAVGSALESGGLIILTGGLGPTGDDVTRDAVALALGRTLTLNPGILEWPERRFQRLGRKMAERSAPPSYLMDGAGSIPARNGTARGQWLEQKGAVVMLLPGPPRER